MLTMYLLLIYEFRYFNISAIWFFFFFLQKWYLNPSKLWDLIIQIPTNIHTVINLLDQPSTKLVIQQLAAPGDEVREGCVMTGAHLFDKSLLWLYLQQVRVFKWL